MTPFRGQTENAGHFLQPATKAIGHSVILDSSSFCVWRGDPFRYEEAAMTTLFASGLKCPDAQATSNDYCNPGAPYRYVDTSHMDRPLIQSPHSMNNGHHTEENT